MTIRRVSLAAVLLLLSCNLLTPAVPGNIEPAVTPTMTTAASVGLAATDTPKPTEETPAATVRPAAPSPILLGFYSEGAGNHPSGLYLGASQGSEWLDAAAVPLAGGETWRLYSADAFLGTAVGGAPHAQPPICPDDRYVDIDPVPASGSEVFALTGGWDALPRPFDTLSNDIDVYVQVIRDLLDANGLSASEVHLQQTLRVDLDGDGADEVLLAASYFAVQGLPSITAGDYSLVILRTVSGADAVTLPLIADYYTEAAGPAAANQYRVAAFLDLNGDGRMEIIVRARRYEGSATVVFAVDGLEAVPVLVHDCGGYAPVKPPPMQ